MVLLFGFQVLVSVLLLTTSLATPLKRTVAQVEDDIVGIITQAAMLDATLNDVPTTGPVTGVGASVFVVKQLCYIGPTSPAVLQSILSAFAALETTVNQTVADMKVVFFALLCDRHLIFHRRLDLLARRMLQLSFAWSWILSLPCWMH
jgi:hypothetical protein